MSTSRSRLALALLLGGLVPATALAQDPFQSSLPAGTSIYIGASDLSGALEGFKTSALYKIWSAEETQEFLADLLKEGEKQYAQAMQQAKAMHEQGMFPVAPEKLEKVRLQGAHFAVTDLSLGTDERPGFRVGVVLSLDFGNTADIVKELLPAVMPMLMQGMGPNPPEPQVREVAGSQLTTLRLPGVPPFLSFNYAFSGTQLLIGTDTDRLASMMTAMAEGGDGGFLASKLYRTVDSKIGGRPAAFEMYVDTEQLLDRSMAALKFAAQMDPDPDVDIDGIVRAVEALGLSGLKGLGMRTGWENGKGYVDSYLVAPKSERKGLSALLTGAGTIDPAHLSWIPKDVGSFSIASMPRLSGLYDTIMNAVKAYDENAHAMAEAQIASLKEQLGLDVPALFGSIGGEMLTYSRPVTGLMAAPEMVISMGCPTPDVMLGQIKKLTMLSEGTVEIVETAGEDTPVYGINVMLGGGMGGGMNPMDLIDPAFSFVQGQMVFALNRSDLRNAVARMKGEEKGEDVTKNPEFAAYLDVLPENVNAISFADMKATVEGLYGAVTSVIGFMEVPADVPLDLGLLPTSETMTAPLFGQVSWSITDDEGVMGRMVGPMGPEYMALIGAVAVGVAAFTAEMR